MARRKKKIKLDENLMIIGTVLFITVFVLILYFETRPKTTINYYGHVLEFRRDIKMAKDIPFYDNCSVNNVIFSPATRKVNIVFYANDSYKNYVALEAIELTYKLDTAFIVHNQEPKIKKDSVFNITSLSELNSSPYVFNILIISPALSNQTKVTCNDNLAVIQGKDLTGLDLATIKFILAALGIKP